MTSSGPPRLLPKAEPGSSSTSPTPDGGAGVLEPPAKRRCISSACMPCRKRKSKCDGIHPSCHACTAVYGSACYYDIDSDHRRKGALKRDIAQLKEDLDTVKTILDALRSPSEADADDVYQLLRSHQNDDYQTIATEVQKLSHDVNGKIRPSAVLEGELAEFSVKSVTVKPGDNALYGHTSNLHAGGQERPTTSGINQLETWTNVTRDKGFISHLLDLYLSWSHPFYLLFSEEVFIHGMQEHKSKYCTQLLVNAVLAIGCHFSDRPEARPNPLDPSTVGDHFFNEAERLFRSDGRPCLTTVQALALMSIHQAMNSRDSLGWLYICQAIAMAIELGLNKDQHSQPNSKITPSEAQARRITFWGIYLLQTGWAICVGRISILPRTAIRVERPNLLDVLETKSWLPHGQQGYRPGAPHPLEQPGVRYTLLSEAGRLCELVDDIVQMFYAPRDRITSRRLQKQHEKLQEWYAALPPCLTIRDDGPTLPQVICLHMYYWNCITHLFRPFMRLTFVQSTSTTRKPRDICTGAANKISDLLRIYRRFYGLRRANFMATHCVVTAGIIHIVNVSATPEVPEQSQDYLCEAIRGLQEMNTAYPLVERYLQLLQSLTIEWCQKFGIPRAVSEAYSEAHVVSPSPTSSISATSQPTPSIARKQSAPDLLALGNGQQPNNMFGSNIPPQQSMYWTPFPNNQDGMLLGPVENGTEQQHMAITNLLAPNQPGDWPQLNRDGFTMNGEDGVWGWNETFQ